jgi:hypothetical protein
MPDESRYSVMVGCDLAGDTCLYVMRDGRYLTEDELDTLSEVLALRIDELLAPETVREHRGKEY